MWSGTSRLRQYLTEQGFLVAGHDHVGHGQSVAGPEQWGHFGVRDAGATLVEDVHALTVQLREQYPGVPLFLLGHSMGSFVARRYMMTYGAELSGALVIAPATSPHGELLLGRGWRAVLPPFSVRITAVGCAAAAVRVEQPPHPAPAPPHRIGSPRTRRSWMRMCRIRRAASASHSTAMRTCSD